MGTVGCAEGPLTDGLGGCCLGCGIGGCGISGGRRWCGWLMSGMPARILAGGSPADGGGGPGKRSGSPGMGRGNTGPRKGIPGSGGRISGMRMPGGNSMCGSGSGRRRRGSGPGGPRPRCIKPNARKIKREKRKENR
jgi:hypothetical protein